MWVTVGHIWEMVRIGDRRGGGAREVVQIRSDLAMPLWLGLGAIGGWSAAG